MAILHKATLVPSKLELIASHLPHQPWFVPGDVAGPVLLGAYRFDDPDGEVGLETHIVGHGNAIYQVPLSYRGAPLPGAERWLIGTMEHSVLGRRWVYDACADPVYVTALATAILTGQQEAAQFVEMDGKLEPRPSTAKVSGSGAPDTVVPLLEPHAPVTANGVTTIDAGALHLEIPRVVDPGRQPRELALNGTWEAQDLPVELAAVTYVPA
jgi:Maltokinase N-terminal cap domain